MLALMLRSIRVATALAAVGFAWPATALADPGRAYDGPLAVQSATASHAEVEVVGPAPEVEVAVLPPTLEVSSLETQRGQLVWSIEHDARRERKRRIAGGILQVSAGALQTAMGLYVLIDVPADVDTVDFSGILNTAAGGGLVLQGILGLARRGPLEAMVRDPAFERAKASDEGDAWIDRRLERAARRGRIERSLAGSLSLAGGLAIIGLGINNLVDDNLRDKPAQVVLGAAEIGSGLAFASLGIRWLVVPSQAEHTVETWKHGRPAFTVSRVRSVRVSPTLGGIQVSGCF